MTSDKFADQLLACQQECQKHPHRVPSGPSQNAASVIYYFYVTADKQILWKDRMHIPTRVRNVILNFERFTSQQECVINKFVRLRLSPPIYATIIFERRFSSVSALVCLKVWGICAVVFGLSVVGSGWCRIIVFRNCSLLSSPWAIESALLLSLGFTASSRQVIHLHKMNIPHHNEVKWLLDRQD